MENNYNTLSYLRKLRFLQVGRVFRSVGFVLIFFLLIATAAYWSSLLIFLREGSPLLICVIVFFILLGIHFYRKDHDFLRAIADSPSELNKIYLQDYFLAISLVLIFSLMLGNIFATLLLFIPPIIVAALPAQKISASMTFPEKWLHLIPVKYHEMRVGMRKKGWAIIFLILISILSFIHISLYIISLLGLSLLFSEWYKSRDHLAWIRRELPFIKRKLIKHLGIYILIILPATIMSTINHPNMWAFILYAFICYIMIITFGIVSKYARFHPVFSYPDNTMVKSFYIIFLIFPGFILASLFMLIRQWMKANKNLNIYDIH